MTKDTTKKNSKPQPIITIRLKEGEWEILNALAKFSDCEKTPLIRSCAYEQIDRLMDVQKWQEACNKCEKEGAEYSKTEMLL